MVRQGKWADAYSHRLADRQVTIVPPKDRKFTLGEITDLINESLMAQKFILIRRETSFLFHPADERVDPTLVPRIEMRELKTRGKTELVQVVIPVPAGCGDDLASRDSGSCCRRSARSTRVKDSLIILDTAGNVTRIHELLQKLQCATNKGADRLTHACKFRDAKVVAEFLKVHLARSGPEDAFAIGIDDRSNSLTISARPKQLASARKLIEDLDKNPQQDDRKRKVADLDGDGRPDIVVAPQSELRKYNVLPGTADALAKLLLDEMPSLRIIAVRQSNQLMVLATPNEHSALAAKFTEFIVDGDTALETVTILLSRSDEGMTDKLRKLFPDTKIKPGEVEMPSIRR